MVRLFWDFGAFVRGVRFETLCGRVVYAMAGDKGDPQTLDPKSWPDKKPGVPTKGKVGVSEFSFLAGWFGGAGSSVR